MGLIMDEVAQGGLKVKIGKKVISNLRKCYSIAPLTYNGSGHILVAAEKQDPCYLFDLSGNMEDTVWESPGGVMSMVQIPGSNGVFLATHKFYSPNDSKEAEIVIVSPRKEGGWEVRTLVCLPHVHRFDIVTRNGTHYLIACALKSGHRFKDDWSMPGKVYGAVLPNDLSRFNRENQLELNVIKDNMLKNHGYYKITRDDGDFCLVSCNEGVYRFLPPNEKDGDWSVEQLISEPGSDAVLVDMDEDGEEELAVISPFHGSEIYIYKKIDGDYRKVYTYNTADFAHAIYGGTVLGRPSVIIGHRKGERNLLLFTWNKDKKDYESVVLDHGCGPANVYKYEWKGKEILISTNREINEVARYTLSDED